MLQVGLIRLDSKKKALPLTFLLLFSLFPLVYAAPSGFKYYVSLTIDSDDIDETLTDFPVLVALSNSSGINGFDASPIFDEIGDSYNYTAYTDSEGNRLYFEKEYWNATEKTAFVWVKVPTISNTTNTTINLWFTNIIDGSSYNSPSTVWSNNYSTVQHMNDNSTSTVLDSTNNNVTGLKFSANNPTESNGFIGLAQYFDGSNDYINFGNNCNPSAGEGITINYWLNATNPQNASTVNPHVLRKNIQYFLLFSSQGYPWARVYTSTGTYNILNSSSIRDNTYHFLTLSYNMTDLIVYVDGEYANSISATGNIASNIVSIYVGAGSFPDEFYRGNLDEIQISIPHRSEGWVGATYLTQSDNFFYYGEIDVYDTSISALTFGLLALIIAVFAFIFVISKK